MADQTNSRLKSILQQKAEELKKKSIDAGTNHSDIEFFNLVQELEVHQFELEVQNQELSSLMIKAEIEAEKYTNLYDFAPCGYFNITKQDEILELNFSGAALLEKERSELLNKRFAFFVADESKPTFFLFLEKIFESKTSQTCEIELSSPSKISTYALVTGIANEDNTQCLLTVLDITERNKIENSLQKSQEKLQGIFNLANSGIFLIDKFGNFIMFNDWFCKSLGYTRNEFQELNVKTVSHPEDLEKSSILNQKIIDGEIDKYQIEKRYIRKDKSILWCEVSASAIKDQNDNIVNIIKLIYDISDKIANRKALEKSEARLIEAQALAKVGNWETDFSFTDVNWSDETAKILGLNAKSTQSQSPLESFLAIVHPEDRLLVQTTFIHSIKNNTINTFEHRILTPEGSEKIIEQRWKIVRDEHGQPVRAIGTSYDITERKLAEKLIVQSKTRFHSIINSSPVAMALNDENLNITYLNHAFVAMFGYTLEEIPTVQEWFLKAFPNLEYRKKIANSWITALEAVKQTGEDFASMEVNVSCKDGSEKRVMVSATRIINSYDSEYLVNLFDITAQKKAEQALINEKRRLALILIGTGAGTWEWNIQTGLITINERWAELIGYTIEELAPISMKTWRKLTHPDDARNGEENVEKHFQGSLDYCESEFRMKHKNGHWIWILSRGKINKRDLNGEPLLMSGTHLDITKRKLAESALLHNMSLTEATLDSVQNGILAVSHNRTIIKANAKFAEMWKIPNKILNTKYDKILLDFILEQLINPEEFISKVNELYANPEAKSIDILYFKDGRIFERVCKPMYVEGKTMGRVWSFLDITERKLAEEKLIAGEKFLNQTQTIAKLGSYALDLTTEKWTSSNVLDNIFGIDTDFERTIQAWTSIVHPDWREIITNYLQDEVISKKNNFNKEYKISKVDNNEERWVHCLGEISFDKEGQPKLLIGSVQDITERKLIEEKLKLSSEKFQDLVDSTGGIVWEADVKTFNFTYVSKEAERLLGFAIEEWYAEGFWANHLHPEDKDEAISYCVTQTKKMASHDFTYRFIAKNGEILWLRDIVNVVVEDGKPRWLRGVMFDITHLKKTNLLLSESEEKYRGLVENAPYGILIYVENKIAFINDEGLRMLRANNKEEIIGKSDLHFVHPDNIQDIVQIMKEVTKDANASAILEAKFIGIDGIPFDVEIKAIPTVYEHKVAVQVIFNDISLQKQAALELNKINRVYALISQINNLIIRTQNREELFQEICNIAVDFGKFRLSWIRLLDDDNKIITAAFAGYEKGYFTESNVANVLNISEERGPTGIAIQEGRTVICNDIENDPIMKPWRKEAQSRGYSSMISIPLVVRNKKIGVFNLYSDEKNFFSSEEEISLLEKITLNIAFALESILTEEDRKQTEEKIRQLSQAVEQSPVAIVITNTEGKIEYVNPKFVETTGYTLEEIIGQNPRTLKSGHTTKEEYKKLWQTITSGKEWHGEFHNKKKDGTLFWESATISPILNAHGKATHYIAIKEDITERKNVEQDLINAKLRAEESDRLKLAFLANMSHEIRTPMNGILGFTELLKAPGLTGPEQQEYIKIIEKSGKRMLNIINDIISISKIESGQIDISYSETNINEQLNYIHSFFTPEANQKGIHLFIKKQLHTKYNVIKTDEEKLYAILTNLVKNAIKFTNEGSIEFGCEKKGKNIQFYVKDSGIGISDSKKDIVFERFRQANESISRSHEGSGLGLPISKAYIEMLGGTIWVDSEIGKGSTFFFTLPFQSESDYEYENEEEEKIDNAEVDLKIPQEKEIKDLKVLIVEDDSISKLLITIAVKPFSKEILKASSGIEAVEMCSTNPDIDLVLMDINMPIMGGYEATKKIREFNKDLIIIAQTANGMQSDRDDAIDAGFTDYISKPINIKDLGVLIQKYFNK